MKFSWNYFSSISRWWLAPSLDNFVNIPKKAATKYRHGRTHLLTPKALYWCNCAPTDSEKYIQFFFEKLPDEASYNGILPLIWATLFASISLEQGNPPKSELHKAASVHGVYESVSEERKPSSEEYFAMVNSIIREDRKCRHFRKGFVNWSCGMLVR